MQETYTFYSICEKLFTINKTITSQKVGGGSKSYSANVDLHALHVQQQSIDNGETAHHADLWRINVNPSYQYGIQLKNLKNGKQPDAMMWKHESFIIIMTRKSSSRKPSNGV